MDRLHIHVTLKCDDHRTILYFSPQPFPLIPNVSCFIDDGLIGETVGSTEVSVVSASQVTTRVVSASQVTTRHLLA